MELPRVLVLESGRRWIGHVRSKLGRFPVRVHHCTTGPECVALLGSHPKSTLLIQLGANPWATLELLEELNGIAAGAITVLLAQPGQWPYEMAARELGAAAFLYEPVGADVVIGLVQRALRQQLE